MSLTETTIMGAVPHKRSRGEITDFGLAVARELERRHPVHTAKMVARDLSAQGVECTVRTAENILSGHLSARTLTRLVEAYGLGLLIEAGASVTGQTLEQFIRESAEDARRERAAAGERWRRQSALVGELRALHSYASGDSRPVP